jgi:hypothetical protein
MKEASEALNSKTAMEIRYLDVVNNIAKSGNSKVIFLPLDDVEDMK